MTHKRTAWENRPRQLYLCVTRRGEDIYPSVIRYSKKSARMWKQKNKRLYPDYDLQIYTFAAKEFREGV